eukprot:TRINITY_DN92186_c0_g1_i1.p1 TRINITY_DN92186_c0_g1~~TRINITY_DN92186_c0_g1_i1.p1  ORF type:complete len:155 (+),score=19.36 TRINITY_DN92186_c0_g1_i1:59-523(+)
MLLMPTRLPLLAILLAICRAEEPASGYAVDSSPRAQAVSLGNDKCQKDADCAPSGLCNNVVCLYVPQEKRKDCLCAGAAAAAPSPCEDKRIKPKPEDSGYCNHCMGSCCHCGATPGTATCVGSCDVCDSSACFAYACCSDSTSEKAFQNTSLLV